MSHNVQAAFPASVPLLDVNRATASMRDELLSAITAVVDSGRFLFGPDVKELEKSVAKLSGAKHAISCASGSDALLLALMAFDIGPGDEVIVPSFTFFATASAASRLGATPVFVDIDPVSFNMDPEKIEAAITPATKAIIPVHLFGQCADMAPILDIARRHQLKVIEDAAQAIGARYDNYGAGSLGDIGCYSFYPTKNLGGMGDGGMLSTSDDSLDQKLRLLAAHGMSPRYYHKVVGINSRLDSIQAAILNVKFRYLETWAEQRQANADRYHKMFKAVGLADSLVLPTVSEKCDHVWNQYSIRVPAGRRDALRQRLAERNIGTEIYYPVPLHMQECFQSLGYRPGSLPHTEQAAAEVLALPIYPELTVREQEAVVHNIADIMKPSRSAAA